MKTYETFTTVEPQGDIHVAGVPFAPGTEVEVTISPKRKGADEFVEAWRRVCGELRTPQAQALTEEVIQREIDDYRAGR
jgi:hypothetical protein